MPYNPADVSALIDEYSCILSGVHLNRDIDDDCNWAAVQKVLQSDGEWSMAGADAVVRLVREYGAFVLRNALALALVLQVEDGEAGI